MEGKLIEKHARKVEINSIFATEMEHWPIRPLAQREKGREKNKREENSSELIREFVDKLTFFH